MKATLKKVTSLSLGFSFLIMSYTGIMLYFVPKGKVAYWSDWHLFGLSKSQYGDIHTTSMLVFLVFGVLHIYFNWKPIISYLKDTNKKLSFTTKEFLIALSINVVFVLGTLYMVQPFKAYLDLEESIKDYWAQEYGEPPYGHAEETKLKVFCKKMNIDYNKASEILKSQKIIFQPNQSLLNIAKANEISPSKIYELIKKASTGEKSLYDFSNKGDSSIPTGLGRKTLQELSAMGAIDLQKALKKLRAKGLSDVTSENRVKDIADELEMMPIDVYELLSK